jgi:hypothetical protein
MRGSKRRGVLLVAGSVAALLASWWWVDLSRGEPTPFVKPAGVEGRTVTVTYTGSHCQDGSHLDVEERTHDVVVTVYEWEYPTGCDDMGVPYTLTATLSDDIGDRSVVDGACAVPKLQQYPDCLEH